MTSQSAPTDGREERRVESEYQQISVGFRTEQSLEKAKAALQGKDLFKVKTEIESPVSAEVPRERSAKMGISKAAIAGGTIGAIAGATVAIFALSIPNLASLQSARTPLLIFIPLGGALLGAAASSLITFMSGAEPVKSTETAKYKIRVETLPEETQQVTEILLNEGGYLL
jgi:hypothetical protein